MSVILKFKYYIFPGEMTMPVRYGQKKKVKVTPEEKLAIRAANIKRYRESVGKKTAKNRPIQGTGLETLKSYAPSGSSATSVKSGGSAEDLVKSLRKNKGHLPRKGF